MIPSSFHVLDFWFGPKSGKNLWFQTNSQLKYDIDQTITKNYHHLLKNLEEKSIYNIFSTKSLQDIVAAIICLDQFSRHIYRNCPQYSS